MWMLQIYAQTRAFFIRGGVMTERLFNVIDEYMLDEFDEHFDGIIPDDGEIGLAFTQVELDNGWYEMQVSLDVNTMSLKHYVNGSIILEEKYESEDDAADCLDGASFELLISDCDEESRRIDESRGLLS